MSIPKNEIQKPFRRGRCVKCREINGLCSLCEVYASQDYVPRKEEVVLSGDLMDTFPLSPSYEELVEEREKQGPTFGQILRGAGLTPLQRRVIKLRFRHGLSFLKISKSLGITKALTYKTYKFALKKLKNRLTNSVLVKGRHKPEAKKPIPKQSKNQKLVKPIKIEREPTRYYRRCPRCGAQAFCVDHDFQYCMDCQWNSDSL